MEEIEQQFANIGNLSQINYGPATTNQGCNISRVLRCKWLGNLLGRLHSGEARKRINAEY